MLGFALLLCACLLAIPTVYSIAGAFPSLRNRPCKITAVVSPILILVPMCWPFDGDPLHLDAPAEWLSHEKERELLILLLAFALFFAISTMALMSLVSSVRRHFIHRSGSASH